MSTRVSRPVATGRLHPRVLVGGSVLLTLAVLCGARAAFRGAVPPPVVQSLYPVDALVGLYAGTVSGRCGTAFMFKYVVAPGDRLTAREVTIGRSADGSRIVLSFRSRGCHYVVQPPLPIRG